MRHCEGERERVLHSVTSKSKHAPGTRGFFPFGLYWKEKINKCPEWQLPQLLAGILIKTKLVSFSEQT